MPDDYSIRGPIKLTEFGESFEPIGGGASGENDLDESPGIHLWCNGLFSLKQVSETHAALLCNLCSLRVCIPLKVKTYADLQRHFKQLDDMRRKILQDSRELDEKLDRLNQK